MTNVPLPTSYEKDAFIHGVDFWACKNPERIKPKNRQVFISSINNNNNNNNKTVFQVNHDP